MNLTETAALLALAAAYDNRTVTDDAVHAWRDLLADLPPADARDAVLAHYRRCRDWLMPADVVAHVRRLRRDRLAAAGSIEAHVTADPADPAAYRADLARVRAAIADGADPADAARPTLATVAGGAS